MPRRQKIKAQRMLSFYFLESGSALLSRAVSSQVPSALKGLTSVFGMGTGGSLSPLPPENCEGLCSPLSSWFPLRHFITEASILETFRTSTHVSLLRIP